MIIFVDIDETICTISGSLSSSERDYSCATPIKQNIEKINQLYKDGNTIIYWTARGSVTGFDWSEITKKQLKSWCANHHEIRFGKPYYDLMICDKTFNPKDW